MAKLLLSKPYIIAGNKFISIFFLSPTFGLKEPYYFANIVTIAN